LRYSCGHVSTKKNVRGIKDAAASTPPQLRSSRYIRYRDNIGYPRYGERYDIGDNQYSSNNLSYCPINRFLESVPTLTCASVSYLGIIGIFSYLRHHFIPFECSFIPSMSVFSYLLGCEFIPKLFNFIPLARFSHTLGITISYLLQSVSHPEQIYTYPK
jgi:hypothetical protein